MDGVVGRGGRVPRGVAGYLRVREGEALEASPEAGSRSNRAVFEEWSSVCGVGGGDVLAELSEIERGMCRVADLLRWSQPARDGRLTVRWWLMRGGDRVREPVLLRARRSGGRESYERVDQRVKAKLTGDWAVNSEGVVLALRVWWLLVKRRSVLLERLREAAGILGRRERRDVGDWRFGVERVEVEIEVACGRAGEWKAEKARAVADGVRVKGGRGRKAGANVE